MTDKKTSTKKAHAKDQTARPRSSIDPLIIAGGAAAVGAAIGALVPRSDAEKRALAPLGTMVRTAGTRALHSAREAVSNEVKALPIVGQAAAALIDQVIDAVVPASTGAIDSD